nr:MAG TPA: hypothetical protein [Caudoviricetes sp.]
MSSGMVKNSERIFYHPRALAFCEKSFLVFSCPDHDNSQNRNICYGKHCADHDDRRNERFFCLGTNGGQLVFRSDQSFIQRIDCSLKCGLCRRNLSFQCGLIGFACCIKCRLGSSQRVAQCFDLIVQRLIAVCNGFVEFCFGIIKILLHLIYDGLK